MLLLIMALLSCTTKSQSKMIPLVMWSILTHQLLSCCIATNQCDQIFYEKTYAFKLEHLQRKIGVIFHLFWYILYKKGIPQKIIKEQPTFLFSEGRHFVIVSMKYIIAKMIWLHCAGQASKHVLQKIIRNRKSGRDVLFTLDGFLIYMYLFPATLLT